MVLCLQLGAGAATTLDPLDALSDTLKDIKPVPQPVPADPKDVVKVEGVDWERAASRLPVLICQVFAGERSDGREAG